MPQRSPVPPGCLDYEALTARMGWASVRVARSLNNLANRRRDDKEPHPGDLPPCDGYAGQRPYWREQTIDTWVASKPRTLAAARDHADGTKTCSRCGKRKQVDDFQVIKNRRGDETRTATCKTCRSSNARRWNKANPDRHAANLRNYSRTERARRQRKATQYGIQWWELAALEAAQQGICAICGDSPQDGLAIDHNHTTGAVRGLLCTLCNVGLGHFRDDPRRLIRAALYLKERAGGILDRQDHEGAG